MISYQTSSELKFIDVVQNGVPETLDRYLETAEAISVDGVEILDYIPISKFDTILSNWISKLAHGGKICLGGTNLDYICSARTRGLMSLQEVVLALYGTGDFAWTTKVGAYNPQQVKKFMEQRGLVVTLYRVEDAKFCITGVRP